MTEFSPYFLFFGREPCISIEGWGYQEDIYKFQDGDWLGQQCKLQKEVWDLIRRNTQKNWVSKAKPMLSKSKESDLEVGQKVLLRENKIIGRAKLADKFGKRKWVIEEVLNRDCGLYRMRPEGSGAKVIHRRNIKPLVGAERNEGEENMSALDTDNNDNLETAEMDASSLEMPDMEEVLTRFGFDFSKRDNCESKVSVDEQVEQEQEVTMNAPVLRRSERIRNRQRYEL